MSVRFREHDDDGTEETEKDANLRRFRRRHEASELSKKKSEEAEDRPDLDPDED